MKRPTRHTWLRLCLLLSTGCGSLGGSSASDDIPTAGVTGWVKFAPRPGSGLTAPFVLCNGFFQAPSVVATGSGFRLWYTRVDGSLGSAEATGGLYDWKDQGPLALPDPGPWASSGVALSGGIWRMAAAARDRSRIAFFHSADGTTWSQDGQLLPTLAWQEGALDGPSLLYDQGTASWLLFFEAGSGALGRAVSPDGLTWTSDPLPLFSSEEVISRSGWPVAVVGEPDVVLDASRPGPPVYRMWFAGLTIHGPFGAPSDWSIGYAGSFDSGAGWQPYVGDPVLDEVTVPSPGAPPVFPDERRPSVLQLGSAWRMYYEQTYVDPVSGSREPCVALAFD